MIFEYSAGLQCFIEQGVNEAVQIFAGQNLQADQMALIRVTSCKVEDNTAQQDMILNTAHIALVYPDNHKPARGVWVQLVTGEPVLVCLTFEEMWMLIQRET